MKGSTGILLIAVGLILLYVIMSDKYQCFTLFVNCMTGADLKTPDGYTRGTPTLPTLPKVGGGKDLQIPWGLIPGLPPSIMGFPF